MGRTREDRGGQPAAIPPVNGQDSLPLRRFAPPPHKWGGQLLLSDQEVFPVPPAVEEAVHVAFRQAVALGRVGRLPEPVLVLDDRQAADGHRPAAAVPESKAELDVGHAVEAEPRVEAADRGGIRLAEGHAVTLDGVDLRAGALVELLERAGAAQAKWT